MVLGPFGLLYFQASLSYIFLLTIVVPHMGADFGCNQINCKLLVYKKPVFQSSNVKYDWMDEGSKIGSSLLCQYIPNLKC